jgi:dipeptidyl aminopeptidase/acylaminoacyl peptidase
MSFADVAEPALAPEDIGLLRQVEDPQLAPDATRVAFVVADPDPDANRYRRRIWISSTAADSAGPRPFTGAGSERAPRWSPDGRLLAFVSDDEGGTSQICILPVEDGGERAAVATWPASVSDLSWSPDGRWLAFIARDPDVDRYGGAGAVPKPAKDMPPRRVTTLRYRFNGAGWTIDRPARIFVVPADGSRPPRPLTAGSSDVDGLAWSPDSARIAFVSGHHATSDLDWVVDLWTVEVDGRSDPERLIGDGAAYSSPSWSPDGTALAYLVHATPLENPRHRQVGVLQLDTKGHQVLTASLDRNCGPYGVAHGVTWVGDRLVFGVEDQGNVHLYQVPSDGSQTPTLLVGGDRWISEWAWAGDTVALVDSTAVTLPELVLAVGEMGGQAAPVVSAERRITDLTSSLADRAALVAPVQFSARSKDGSVVECWALPPLGADVARRHPTLLNVHGGPFTQYGNHLTDDFQLQAAAGFGVLYCNPRGSSGYSEAWGRAIRWPGGDDEAATGWGSVDFEDVMACVDEATKRFDWVDPERLGILGGSYGGYMTSWAIGHTDRFKAACSERACNNLATMEHSMDIAGFIRSYVGRDLLDDEAAYRRHSPVTYVKDMTTPVLIVHSEDDLRCPINQAEELFVSLRRLGREPVMIRFPGETHELTRSGSPRHRIMRAHLILDWFQEHLR